MLESPLATTTHLQIPFDTVVLLTFYFIAAAYIIYSGILYYHWNTYSIDKKITNLTLLIYFSISLPLLIVIGIMVLVI